MPRLTISLTNRTHFALKEAAARQNRSMASIIEESLGLRGIRPYDTAREIVATARASSELDADAAMALAVDETRRLVKGGSVDGARGHSCAPSSRVVTRVNIAQGLRRRAHGGRDGRRGSGHGAVEGAGLRGQVPRRWGARSPRGGRVQPRRAQRGGVRGGARLNGDATQDSRGFIELHRGEISPVPHHRSAPSLSGMLDCRPDGPSN